MTLKTSSAEPEQPPPQAAVTGGFFVRPVSEKPRTPGLIMVLIYGTI